MDAPHSKQFLIISISGFLFSKLVPMLPELQAIAVVISILGGILSILLNIPRLIKLIKNWLGIVIVVSLFSLTSCSSGWYLKQAIKKNPKLLDSLKVEKVITLHDTVRGEVKSPEHDFSSDSLMYDSIRNATVELYSDSLIELWGTFDSLTHIKKVTGKIKERKIPFEVIREIHDTVTVDCPPQVVYQKGIPIKYGILYVFLFLILLVLYLKDKLEWQQRPK